jgi:hypothetical protein
LVRCIAGHHDQRHPPGAQRFGRLGLALERGQQVGTSGQGAQHGLRRGRVSLDHRHGRPLGRLIPEGDAEARR